MDPRLFVEPQVDWSALARGFAAGQEQLRERKIQDLENARRERLADLDTRLQEARLSDILMDTAEKKRIREEQEGIRRNLKDILEGYITGPVDPKTGEPTGEPFQGYADPTKQRTLEAIRLAQDVTGTPRSKLPPTQLVQDILGKAINQNSLEELKAEVERLKLLKEREDLTDEEKNRADEELKNLEAATKKAELEARKNRAEAAKLPIEERVEPVVINGEVMYHDPATGSVYRPRDAGSFENLLEKAGYSEEEKQRLRKARVEALTTSDDMRLIRMILGITEAENAEDVVEEAKSYSMPDGNVDGVDDSEENTVIPEEQPDGASTNETTPSQGTKRMRFSAW